MSILKSSIGKDCENFTLSHSKHSMENIQEKKQDKRKREYCIKYSLIYIYSISFVHISVIYCCRPVCLEVFAKRSR